MEKPLERQWQTALNPHLPSLAQKTIAKRILIRVAIPPARRNNDDIATRERTP
jgi:hypothetical protein